MGIPSIFEPFYLQNLPACIRLQQIQFYQPFYSLDNFTSVRVMSIHYNRNKRSLQEEVLETKNHLGGDGFRRNWLAYHIVGFDDMV